MIKPTKIKNFFPKSERADFGGIAVPYYKMMAEKKDNKTALYLLYMQ